jgi:hypothetical protein
VVKREARFSASVHAGALVGFQAAKLYPICVHDYEANQLNHGDGRPPEKGLLVVPAAQIGDFAQDEREHDREQRSAQDGGRIKLGKARVRKQARAQRGGRGKKTPDNTPCAIRATLKCAGSLAAIPPQTITAAYKPSAPMPIRRGWNFSAIHPGKYANPSEVGDEVGAVAITGIRRSRAVDAEDRAGVARVAAAGGLALLPKLPEAVIVEAEYAWRPFVDAELSLPDPARGVTRGAEVVGEGGFARVESGKPGVVAHVVLPSHELDAAGRAHRLGVGVFETDAFGGGRSSRGVR